MDVLLKVLPIYFYSVIAQIWFNYFNFRFIYSKIKVGDYTLPFIDHTFKSVETFTVAVWLFNAPFCYIPATVLAVKAYEISVRNFDGRLSTALIVSVIASLLTSVWFMKIMTGEVMNKNGYIALILIIITSFFSVNSSK